MAFLARKGVSAQVTDHILDESGIARNGKIPTMMTVL
jgi:hypothetical protein